MSTSALPLDQQIAAANLAKNPSFQAVTQKLMNEAQTSPAVKETKLQEFEGFLKKAGHVTGVILKDIVKYAVPITSAVALVDPAEAPLVAAFNTSVTLVQNTVVGAQQKWAADGSEANTKKLADVIEVVEAPIIALFAQAGRKVDTAYVTNLVNGVVAILNAQPNVLP